jgi:hypothetical protein
MGFWVWDMDGAFKTQVVLDIKMKNFQPLVSCI